MPSNKEGDIINYRTIGISRLKIDPNHIRRIRSNISGLKQTIADVGLLQPILVREVDGEYVVIDGTRRLQALKELEVPELILGRDILVDIRETEADTKFKQIIANIQREDLNDIELGKAFVMLKEQYGYQYTEIAEIIGKTQHYVSSKVGMAKRLTPEVQSIIIGDWEAAKCIQNTMTDEPSSPYIMNVNIIEDIARLPPELQKAAYEMIKENEMDKKEALKCLKSIKQEAEVLKMAEDARGIMETYTFGPGHEVFSIKEFIKYIKKLDRDVEMLSETIKSGTINREEVVPALESLIIRLNSLYSEIKDESVRLKATV